MKLRIASDFHLEFYTYKTLCNNSSNDINDFKLLQKTDEDSEQVLCLAGDVCSVYYLENMQLFFESLAKRFKKILLVSGNHEFYKDDIEEGMTKLKTFYDKFDITLLDNTSYKIDDVTFFGNTLWTDFSNNDPFSKAIAQKSMPDYRIISYKGMPLTPDDTYDFHKRDIHNIFDFVENTAGKKVVMTHHLPSWQSVAPKWKYSDLTSAFASEYAYEIGESDIGLFIHGHTHDPMDYMINNTRVVCNPSGYPSRGKLENNSYNSNLVVDI